MIPSYSIWTESTDLIDNCSNDVWQHVIVMETEKKYFPTSLQGIIVTNDNLSGNGIFTARQMLTILLIFENDVFSV